jgi:hypothetical protein
MFGDHEWRPTKAIMIQCTGMLAFRADFAKHLGAPQEAADEMAAVLVNAMLSPKDESTIVPNLVQELSNFFQKLKDMQCALQSHPKAKATNDLIKLVGTI